MAPAEVVASPRFPRGGIGTASGRAVPFALSSGHATPRSGIGSSGALGSGWIGSDAGGAAGVGAACASKDAGSNAEAPAAHHRDARITLKPRPLIQAKP